MSEYTVRQALVKDISEFKKIELETSLSFWSEADYNALVNNHEAVILTALESNNIVGFVLARLITSMSEAEILNFGVKPEYQRKGAGQRLLRELLFALRSADFTTLWLEVRESNQKARRFYLQNGFVKAGVRKLYYQNPNEDALVLKLDLEASLATSVKLL